MGRGAIGVVVVLTMIVTALATLTTVVLVGSVPDRPALVSSICRPADQPDGVTRWCAELHHADPLFRDPVDELWLVPTLGTGAQPARYYATDLPFRTDESGVVVAFVPGAAEAHDRTGLTVRVPDQAYAGVLG